MFARYCAPSLGRFLSVDPVLGSVSIPQSWNRYGYVQNNPVNYIDPTGETLSVSGSQSAQDKFKDTANGAMHGKEAVVDGSGNTTLQSNGVQGPPTEEQAAFEGLLSDVIGDSSNTAVTLSEGSATLVGSYGTGDIDMDDVQQLDAASGSGPGATAAGALGHELAEQYSKQVGGFAYGGGAHAFGIGVEDAINGSTRGPELPPVLNPQSNGTFSGSITIPYKANGQTRFTALHIKQNNVVKARKTR